MVDYPTTWSGVQGGMELGIKQQEANTQQQNVTQTGTYQQGLLKVQQEGEKNKQQRELYVQHDKNISELWGLIKETDDQMRLTGMTPVQRAQKLKPLFDAVTQASVVGGKSDAGTVAAQFGVLVGRPAFDPNSVNGSGGTPAPQATAQPSSSADVPAGTTMAPGQNLTGPDKTITGIDYGPVQGKEPAAPQVSEVDKLSSALMRLPATPEAANIRDVLKARLGNAITQSTPDASVHFAKTESGTEIPLVIKKQGGNISITDTNGNPYVAPTGDEGDSAVIGEAIISGKQPPVLTGLYKNAKGVKAYLARKDFDQSTALQEWTAAQKQITSLNGPQMIRYAGLAKSVVNTIDEIKDLSEKMDLSGVPLANRVKIAAYMQTAGNSEGGQLAARYLGAVTTLKEEFANLAQGGYAPTEASFALANKQINEDFGVKQMNASLTEVQRLIRYRLNGIPNFQTVGPDAPNRYRPGGSTATPVVPSAAAGSPMPPPPSGAVLNQ